MNRLNYLFIFLIFISVVSQATPSDSLVRWNELNFSTPFEKTTLTQFLKNNEKNFARSFMANSASADQDQKYFEEKFNLVLAEISGSDVIKKKNDKKVKFIYQKIHERFLTKYEEENRFYEIVKTGNYNCVTATALYALFFEKLNIPYTIKEEPTHVYLVAYPGAENILVETTTPASGFLAFQPEFKSKFINTLKSQKIIGSAEAAAANTDELFNKYYFGKENINLTQLVGIHYLNDALFKRDHNDFEGAYEQVKKGYLFYPNARSEFLLASFTALLLEKENLDLLKKSSLIGRISRFKNAGITTEMIKGEFYNLTQTVLTKNNDKVLYKKCYDQVMQNIYDSELEKEVAYIYNYESGRIFYNQGNHIRAKPYFAKALEIQPNNVDLSGIFISSLAQSFRNERNNRLILDSLEAYKVRFPSLDQNNNFNSMMAYSYIIEAGDSYEKGDATRGEKFQLMFETIYETNKNITLMSTDAVGRAYSEACVYYFKKGQKARAKQLLDKGLSIAPDNYQLKVRKQMITNGY